jgi:hypothetical protein
MSQRNLVITYLGFMSVVSTSLGGYVACGAQKYRVPIHGNEPDAAGQRPTTASGGQAATEPTSAGAAQSLFGVHSSRGWAKKLPVHFRTSKEMSEPVAVLLKKAMTTWESAVGKSLFVYDGSDEKQGSNFRELYSPLDDAINGHYFDFAWTKATGKAATVLATTIWENDPKDATSIVKADIRYNNEFYLFGDTLKEFSQGQRTIVDMQSLALHELGHLLGLMHISETVDRYSVMNPSLFIGEGMITRRLSAGDIERIRTVYGVGDATLAEKLEKADDFPQTN